MSFYSCSLSFPSQSKPPHAEPFERPQLAALTRKFRRCARDGARDGARWCCAPVAFLGGRAGRTASTRRVVTWGDVRCWGWGAPRARASASAWAPLPGAPLGCPTWAPLLGAPPGTPPGCAHPRPGAVHYYMYSCVKMPTILCYRSASFRTKIDFFNSLIVFLSRCFCCRANVIERSENKSKQTWHKLT